MLTLSTSIGFCFCYLANKNEHAARSALDQICQVSEAFHQAKSSFQQIAV